MKATADHGRWWRTLPVQGSDLGFGALHLENLERYAIDDQDLPLDAVTAELWRVIDQVATKLDKRDSPLVLGSKALHHVLPELVPPMDRASTGWFLAWGPSAWTRSSAKVSFTQAMKVFHLIGFGSARDQRALAHEHVEARRQRDRRLLVSCALPPTAAVPPAGRPGLEHPRRSARWCRVRPAVAHQGSGAGAHSNRR